MVDWRKPFQKVPVGKGRLVRDGEEVAILTIGHPGNFAAKACEELDREGFHPAHYDMRYVKPLDEELLHEIFSRFKRSSPLKTVASWADSAAPSPSS